MSGSKKLLWVVAFFVMGGIYLYRIFDGTGPMDLAYAGKLVGLALQTEVNDIEVIAPDGEVAHAPGKTLNNVKTIACPELASGTGSLPGRYGQGGRTYGSATFECLFLGESPSARKLYFSGHVYRSADPSVQGYTKGHLFSFRRSDRTRALMRDLGRQTRPYSSQEQAELWAELATDDIYVPADKTQKSRLERAMEKHIERIGSQ